MWLATLLFVRYGLHTAFHKTTSHRGVWHTWIAGIACAFASVIIFYYVFDRPDGVAWLAGIGFTMSLFIAGLAFGEGELLPVAKLAILAASVAAWLGGVLVLRAAGGREGEPDRQLTMS